MTSHIGLKGACQACLLLLLLSLSAVTKTVSAQTAVPDCSGHGELSPQGSCICEVGYTNTNDTLGCIETNAIETIDDVSLGNDSQTVDSISVGNATETTDVNVIETTDDHDHEDEESSVGDVEESADDHDDHDHAEDEDEDHDECNSYGHVHDGVCECSAGYSSVNSNGTACELSLEPEYFMNTLMDEYFNTTTERIYIEGMDKLIASLVSATTAAVSDEPCSENGHLDGTVCHCDSGYTLSADGQQCLSSTTNVEVDDEPAVVDEPCSENGHLDGTVCHCDSGYTLSADGQQCLSSTTNVEVEDEPAVVDEECSGNGHLHGTECHCDTGYTLSADGLQCTAARRRRQTTDEVASPCLDSVSLFELYNIDPIDGATAAQFAANFSPAIVQMIDSGACVIAVEAGASTVVTDDTPSTGQAYLYAMCAVLIISLTSLGGVLVIPLLLRAPKAAKWVLMFLVALAVGVLIGDSVMHLLPIALGVHFHSDDGSLVVLTGNEMIYRTMTVCGGMFFFVLIEAAMDAAGLGHGHSHNVAPEDIIDLGHMHEEDSTTESEASCGHTHQHGVDGRVDNDSDSNDETKISDANDDTLHETTDKLAGRGDSRFDTVTIGKGDEESDGEKGDKVTFKSKGKSYPKFTGWGNVDNVTWYITVGDGIHNFVDGVSVGASFAVSTSTGISTAIAVFLHELPQEFGDFGIYLASGTGLKRALALNMGSGLTGLLGVVLGIQAGQNWTPWILAFTAGMFIYIALVSMYPQLKDSLRAKNSPNLSNLVQMTAMLIGWAIMVAIAFDESH
ncbi:hypothetical protein SARC_10546 [Sphaeroforma arctica JP610]|uniref:EGF-like domain-containing protein n=1 Tax=Sphaeroforma arctica JP610 TaxID=667725 RepID=A0A0L0FJM2_9EUKA|nr:hypothetical protein SARC_10546 [Sphaeroforma arctica JP610]KNC76979.1 hypothetical protein SARC_10546 [Sphaeroforma arctica JP610]|eukprot:XP_014150881.1 hypothetical protein SARC_10546 [Sphaeroforma arctica JP610]